MSSVDQIVDSESDIQSQPESFNPAQADWYLQRLISMVNGTEIEFPITLYVDGTIVTGYLVSGHKYFDGLGMQLSGFFGDVEDAERAIAGLIEPREIYLADKDSITRPPDFVHIREARVVTPGQSPIPSEGVWWRGRVASVSGFNFGSMVFSKS